MSVRAFRGATCLKADNFEELTDVVVELVKVVLEENRIQEEDLISMIFTVTPDLVSGFPATALRTAGFSDVPLMCATEIPVEGALPRTVRVMIHADSELLRTNVKHVFLRGAEVLRGGQVLQGLDDSSNVQGND